MLDNDVIKMSESGLCPSQWNSHPVGETNIFLAVQGHSDTQGHKGCYVKSRVGNVFQS